MDKVIPRNDPSSQAMTQDNVVKSQVYMPDPTNLDGSESGESPMGEWGATAGQQSTGVDYAIKDVNQTNGTRQPYLNIPASTENRSAKFKNGEGGPAFQPGQYAGDQYQGK